MSSQSLNALSVGNLSPEGYLLTAVALGAVPLLLAIGTCYLKFSIVLGMLKSGFGTQQTPSNALVAALSVVMSLVVMQPVITKVFERAQQCKVTELSRAPLAKLVAEGRAVIAPWEEFMRKASGERELTVFHVLARNHQKNALDKPLAISPTEEQTTQATAEIYDLPVVIGAFVLTEIKRGFVISFALLIPFFVVDLVVSNLLVGMGLTMMSPIIVSLPLKVLLFISADGWLLLVQNLIQGYQK